MSINNVGTYQPVNNEQYKKLNAAQPHKLDSKNVIDLQNIENQMHDLTKDIRFSNDNPNLSIPTTPIQNENSIKLDLYTGIASKIDSSNFERFLNRMQGLSKEQTSVLQNALTAASDTLDKTQADSDTYGMRICQTNLAFKSVSANLIPEQYRQQFNSYVDDYTKELTDNYLGFMRGFANQLLNTTDPTLVNLGWRQKGKEMMDTINNGTSDFQVSINKYQSQFNSVDVKNPSKAKEQLNTVYRNIIVSGSNQPSVAAEVKNLSEKWNTLMDALGEKNSKLTTSVNCYV